MTKLIQRHAGVTGLTPSAPHRLARAALLLAVMALPDAVGAQGLRLAPPAGAVLAEPRSADFIVAVVNSTPITNHEVRQRLASLERQLARQGTTPPSRQVLARQVLERLINEKAQLQVAVEAGIKVDDAAVDQAELSVARQNQLQVSELRRQLTREGLDVASFREELRDQLILIRLREREVAARVRVSEGDIDDYLREQRGNPDPAAMEINLAQILVEVPENAPAAKVEELRQRAVTLTQRARGGEDFATLARTYSDAPDRLKNSGELGLRGANRYPELFLQATQALAAGAIADPVRSDAGFHVLKVIEKRQAGEPGMTVTQSHARHILLRPGPQLTEAAAREKLADLRRRVATGRVDFASLAREHSQDGSARDGGDLGWTNPGQFVPEFEEAMDRLAPGEISEPVISRFGVHLIQLLERRNTQLTPAQQRDVVRNIVREKKLEESFLDWARDVRARAYVEFREEPR